MHGVLSRVNSDILMGHSLADIPSIGVSSCSCSCPCPYSRCGRAFLFPGPSIPSHLRHVHPFLLRQVGWVLTKRAKRPRPKKSFFLYSTLFIFTGCYAMLCCATLRRHEFIISSLFISYHGAWIRRVRESTVCKNKNEKRLIRLIRLIVYGLWVAGRQADYGLVFFTPLTR
ncbi:hypothetical protein VTN77DRAFT_947 [Rasamsonia byssochlamydoides]|uniref:uncharacterized protein n=1 Tax=Rasamsonia byssochlamydoides TaxID=89139 RepID=UPI0037439496